MLEKNPFNYPFMTYAWVIGLAATGGLIAALKREQSAKKTFIDVLASAMAGLVTFWFCEANAINPLYSAIFIAVNGHLGTKALTRFSDWFARVVLMESSRQQTTVTIDEKDGTKKTIVVQSKTLSEDTDKPRNEP
jgi:hypothetical protein